MSNELPPDLKEQIRKALLDPSVFVVIPESAGLYSINREGKVWSIRNKKFVAIDTYSYPAFRMSNNWVRKAKYVHRTLAELFIPNPENKAQVNHINSDILRLPVGKFGMG